jgi:flagellar hook assembly protein FlgD
VWFSFVHGELSEPLQVVIEVFDIFGRRVATLHEQTAAESGVVPPIHWDGRSDHGNSLVPGVYVYRMTITDSKGKAKTITQRMVRR